MVRLNDKTLDQVLEEYLDWQTWEQTQYSDQTWEQTQYSDPARIQAIVRSMRDPMLAVQKLGAMDWAPYIPDSWLGDGESDLEAVSGKGPALHQASL